MTPELRAVLERTLGVEVARAKPLGGGSINEAFEVSLADGESLFVKTHPQPPAGMFETEARGLAWLAEADAIRVPRVLAVSESGPAFLALELLRVALNQTKNGLPSAWAFSMKSSAAPRNSSSNV